MLITGNKAGIGKWIYENLGGIGLDRDTSFEEWEKIEKEGTDIIIHCAANHTRDITSNSLYPYFEDNVLLTKKLVKLKHKKFIFFSSIDVYPKNNKPYSEDEVIDMDLVKGISSIAKLLSESIVKHYCLNYLILRPTAFLGKYSRRNSLIKIIEDKDCTLTLSGHSRFNYVLYSDILDFIKTSIEKDVKGVYNVASAGGSVTLSEIAKRLGKKVQFGNYNYDVGNISNNKISSFSPNFKKTNSEVINQFIQEHCLK